MHRPALGLPTIRPMRTLGFLSVAHAVNHAQAVLLPLIFLEIIDEFGVGVEAVAFLAAAGAFLSGAVQLSYAGLTRFVSRRRLLGLGGILFGGGFAAQALAGGFATFALPEHPVEDRRIAPAPGRQRAARRAVPTGAPRVRDQRPHRRRQRRHRRRGAHRRARSSPPSAGGARRSPSAFPRSPSPSRSCCSSASEARTGRRRSRVAASARPSAGSSVTATCAGST